MVRDGDLKRSVGKEPLFEPGRVVISDEARRLLTKYHKQERLLLERHSRGDWGLVSPMEAVLNHTAWAINDGRIGSRYALDRRQKAVLCVTTDIAVPITVLHVEAEAFDALVVHVGEDDQT